MTNQQNQGPTDEQVNEILAKLRESNNAEAVHDARLQTSQNVELVSMSKPLAHPRNLNISLEVGEATLLHRHLNNLWPHKNLQMTTMMMMEVKQRRNRRYKYHIKANFDMQKKGRKGSKLNNSPKILAVSLHLRIDPLALRLHMVRYIVTLLRPRDINLLSAP